MAGLLERLQRIPELGNTMHPVGQGHWGVNDRSLLAVLNPDRLRRVLTKMLDENEFLGPYGIRSISKFREQHPYVFNVQGQEYRVDYRPAESNTGMFGGNSNRRGPVWMPVNAMIIRALLNYYLYYGDTFKIECPTGSGKMMNLFEVSNEISDRLTRIFLRDEHSRRPVYGGTEKFQSDPPIGGIICSSSNTFTVTTAPGWVQVIRLVGPGSWLSSSSSMAFWMPNGHSKVARWRASRKREEDVDNSAASIRERQPTAGLIN